MKSLKYLATAAALLCFAQIASADKTCLYFKSGSALQVKEYQIVYIDSVTNGVSKRAEHKVPKNANRKSQYCWDPDTTKLTRISWLDTSSDSNNVTASCKDNMAAIFTSGVGNNPRWLVFRGRKAVGSNDNNVECERY